MPSPRSDNTIIFVCVSICNIILCIQETAQLEAETFVQRQQVALTSEIKTVLDSWVRYEQQQKESEQAELAKNVIAKVMADLKDEKAQKEILVNAIAEIERKSIQSTNTTELTVLDGNRTRKEQGDLDGTLARFYG